MARLSHSDSWAIKRDINRLVEPHRYRRKREGKTPANRPGIPGTVGVGSRSSSIDDPATEP